MKLTWRNRLFILPAGGFPTRSSSRRISRLKTALFAVVKSSLSGRCLYRQPSANRRAGDIYVEKQQLYPEHVEISIRDEERIAGNRTVKPRAGLCRRKWTLLAAERAGSIPDASAGLLLSAKKINVSTAKSCSRAGKRSMKISSTGR